MLKKRIGSLVRRYISMNSPINISEKLSIPFTELKFTASRSSGPGGQHVNKVNTRVTLWFDVDNSPSLSERQKYLIQSRLPTRINKAGILRVVSQKHRSQAANRDEAIERFVSLLHKSLLEVTPRKKTRISKASHKRRLAEKKRRSLIKQSRTKAILRED